MRNWEDLKELMRFSLPSLRLVMPQEFFDCIENNKLTSSTGPDHSHVTSKGPSSSSTAPSSSKAPPQHSTAVTLTPPGASSSSIERGGSRSRKHTATSTTTDSVGKARGKGAPSAQKKKATSGRAQPTTIPTPVPSAISSGSNELDTPDHDGGVGDLVLAIHADESPSFEKSLQQAQQQSRRSSHREGRGRDGGEARGGRGGAVMKANSKAGGKTDIVLDADDSEEGEWVPPPSISTPTSTKQAATRTSRSGSAGGVISRGG